MSLSLPPMMLSAAAWSRLDVLLDAATALDPADRAAWLDARRLRPELRAYLDARLALGPDDLGAPDPTATSGEAGFGTQRMGSGPPVHRARPSVRASRPVDRARRGRLQGAAALVGTAALVAVATTYLARPRVELAR